MMHERILRHWPAVNGMDVLDDSPHAIPQHPQHLCAASDYVHDNYFITFLDRGEYGVRFFSAHRQALHQGQPARAQTACTLRWC